jgi:predicted esterase
MRMIGLRLAGWCRVVGGGGLRVVLVPIALMVATCSGDDSSGTTDIGGLTDASVDSNDGAGDQATGGDETSTETDAAPQADTPEVAIPDAGDGVQLDVADTEELPRCDESGANESLLRSGDWVMGIGVRPLGGLTFPFGLRIVASSDRILTFELWGRSLDGTWTSDEPLTRLCDVAVDVDGGFSLHLPSLWLPGQASLTGSDVEVVDFGMAGTVENDASICGEVTGELPLLSMDMAGSTFKAVPAGMEADPLENACERVENPIYDPIATCPVVSGGLNSMTSAELEREFVVVLPPDFAPAGPVPLVFLFHGSGGTAPDIINASGLDALLETNEFILVVPEGANDPNGDNLFPVEWNSVVPLYDMDNPDLVFFDDILTCVGEAWDVDPARIYVTGISGGGLFSTFVGLHRSEVVAAAAPLSGGYVDGLSWPEGDYHRVPYLVTWGGETDIAVDTDFNDLALNLLADLEAAGHPIASCNHDTGHRWPSEMTAAVWAWLSAWTLDQTDDPFAGGLTPDFPAYCSP